MMLPIGSFLQNGKYRIEDVLSHRDLDTTYRATHAELNQSVVLKARKAFEVENFAIEVLTERFLVEARSLIQLSHPHIGQVIDCFVEDQCPYLVMDFIPGETLDQKIAQSPLSETEAIAYIRQVGSGLAFVHAQRILHRDVKPSHIRVKEDTQSAILVGFGVAHGLSLDEVQVNPDSLTPGFAALEQYLPNHPWSPATDVYGLAATLYALTTGQVPVAADLRDLSRAETREPTPLTEPRVWRPELSLQLEGAILRGMALDVSHRPSTVEQWLAFLPDVVPDPAVPDPAALGGANGQPNPDAMASTLLETVIEDPEPAPFAAETSPPMPKHKPPVARQKAPIRKFIPTPKIKSSARTMSRRTFPRQALLWSAVIAGLGGVAFGLYLKTRLFTPLSTSQDPISPSPQQTIEESFPPKERPQVYETPAENLTPEPTATLQPDPSDPMLTDPPAIEGGGEMPASSTLPPFEPIPTIPAANPSLPPVDPPVQIPESTLRSKRNAPQPSSSSPQSFNEDVPEFVPDETAPSGLASPVAPEPILPEPRIQDPTSP